jgi:RND family efflux transporter MFP subunit
MTEACLPRRGGRVTQAHDAACRSFALDASDHGGSLKVARICWSAAPALLALAVLAGCGEKNTYVAPPPPKVTVAKPVQRNITNYLEATGNSAAVNTANLVARVSGFVQSIDYQDGDAVKKGKVLFVIEPQSYDLKLQQAKAAQASAEATLKQAQLDYERQANLAKSGTASKAALDNATATRDNAQGTLQQAEVNTKLAAINVDYAHVAAPFDGTVTARQVSIGDYVGGAGSPTVLATIVQLEPIYVNFSVSEEDVLRIRVEMRRRGLTPADLKKVPVEVGLQTEEGYPHHGMLDYAPPTIDPSTGTVTARAILTNADHVLLPGMFVRVRVPVGTQENALLVPDVALGTDQSGRYLLVAGKDDVVVQRKVTIGPLEGTLRVIEKGITADDNVIVAGIQRAIPGQKVEPHSAAATTKN